MPEQSRPRTETSHLAVRLVVGVLVSIVLVVAVAAVAMRLTLMGFGGPVTTAGPDLPDQAPGFAGPRLRIDPQGEVEQYEREKRPLLESRGWADKNHHAARIPVDEAARVLVRRGWPEGGAP